MNKTKKIHYGVLLPPLVPLAVCAVASVHDPAGLVDRAQSWSNWILTHFDWLFNWSIFACLLLVVAIYFSPLGRVKIGGANAKPVLSRWRWFAITVCTTIATGILFWGTAEPLAHLDNTPPAGAGNPAVFAVSTLFLHWTLTPYGMYTLVGLLFALAFYNRRQPFALSALLEPVFGAGIHRHGGATIDAICLFALVAGMAGSLGGGVLSLSSGLGWGQSPLILAGITTLIVLAFSVSAATGLQRGIRLLSSVNLAGFLLLAAFVFLLGPTLEAVALSGRGAVDYATNFVPRNLGLDPGIPDKWNHGWTCFYWANWYAWAPITGLFLGRLGVGYTVREFIRTNLLYTSLFGAFWMICFGAMAIVMDDGSLSAAYANGGEEEVLYALLDLLPGSGIMATFTLLLLFLSYVTAADSNISALSGLCVSGVTPEEPESPLWIKMLWGTIIGFMAWLLVTEAGVRGIKLISTLGGFPAMLLLIVAMFGGVRMLFRGADAGVDTIR